MSDQPRKLEFRFDMDYAIDVITIDEIIAVSEVFAILGELQQIGQSEQMNALALLARVPSQLKAIRSMLSKMVWHVDHYLEPDEALPVVGLMSIGQVVSAASGIMEHVNAATVSDTEAPDATLDAE